MWNGIIRSTIYKGYYDYFKALPSQNEAVYTLIHWQLFERKDYDRIREQKDLLSLHDMEAVDLFMRRVGRELLKNNSTNLVENCK